MRIRTLTTESPNCEFPLQWDIALYGDALDTRGREAVQFVQARSSRSSLCKCDVDNPLGLILDGTRTPMRDLLNVGSSTSLLLEATTLDLVELLHLLRAAERRGLAQVDLLYAEPGEYQREAIPLDAPWRREFSLSDNRRFQGVAGFATDLSVPTPKTLVAFLGYEGARLAQAVDQVGAMASWTKMAVFGIPGYAHGWEMNALANNAGTLYSLKDVAIKYCAASSVTGALAILENAHERLAGAGTTVVAPLGTKPHSIASALFLTKHCQYQQATLIWDHPNQTPGRSEHVRRWHLFRVNFSET